MTVRARVNKMLLLGLGLAAGAWLAGWPQAGYGIVAGMPVGIFNYWLVASSVVRPGQDPLQSQRILMTRVLIRMGVAFAALAGAAPLGYQVLLGMLVGLSLQLLTYFGDVARTLIDRKGF